MASPNKATASGVNSGDLITTLLPAAKAGAKDLATKDTGKFHGITCADTPKGSYSVKSTSPSPRGIDFPSILSAMPA